MNADERRICENQRPIVLRLRSWTQINADER